MQTQDTPTLVCCALRLSGPISPSPKCNLAARRGTALSDTLFERSLISDTSLEALASEDFPASDLSRQVVGGTNVSQNSADAAKLSWSGGLRLFGAEARSTGALVGV